MEEGLEPPSVCPPEDPAEPQSILGSNPVSELDVVGAYVELTLVIPGEEDLQRVEE